MKTAFIVIDQMENVHHAYKERQYGKIQNHKSINVSIVQKIAITVT